MFDITSMLGNSNTNSNNSLGSFSFTDYAAIKNGSYGKLVKSYYAGTDKANNDAKASSAKSSDSVKSKAAAEVDKTGLTQIKKDADELKSSAEALAGNDLWNAADGKVDTAKITSAVKSFADNYNKDTGRSALRWRPAPGRSPHPRPAPPWPSLPAWAR